MKGHTCCSSIIAGHSKTSMAKIALFILLSFSNVHLKSALSSDASKSTNAQDDDNEIRCSNSSHNGSEQKDNHDVRFRYDLFI